MNNKSLNFIINEHLDLSNDCIIKGWNDKTSKWDEIKLDYATKQNEVIIDLKLSESDSEIIDAFWEAGILTSESEKEIQEWINKKRTENLAPIAIAFDTNLILRGYLRNLLEKIIRPGYYKLDILILLTRTIINEFHSMTNAKYNSSTEKEKFKKLEQEIKNNDNISRLLFDKENNLIKSYFAIRGLSNSRGRRGLKGQIEIDYMYKNLKNQVLLVKPSNMFRSPYTTENKRIEELIANNPNVSVELKELLTYVGTKGLNDMLDSIIREEIDFFRTQTNCQVLFVTMDKQQSTSSNLEQLDCVYLERPKVTLQRKTIKKNQVKKRNITKLILALITKYSVLELENNNKKLFFSLSWVGKKIEELKEGNIVMVIENQNREIVTVENL